MKQIIHIAVNNIIKSKLKAIAIIMLMATAMFVATVGYLFSQSAIFVVDEKTEELETLAKINVRPYVQGNTISMATIGVIEALDNVSYVLPQYNFSGLLEENSNNPIYQVTMNGFDFDTKQFVGADDYRGQNVSGILLPDISYEFNGEIVLRDYVGKYVQYTYEYMKDGEYKMETITCKVIGVYKASGMFEYNPVYMSMDLFSGILENVGQNIFGVDEVVVYLDDSAYMDVVSEKIEELGLEVFYETTIDDYISSLEGFINLGIAVSVIIMAFAVIVMIQAMLSNIGKRHAIIGVLKAYGYSNSKICFMVWFEVFTYSVMSAAISLICGVIFGNRLNEFFEQFLSGVEFSLSIESVLLNILIGVVVSAGASVIPIRRLNKIDVIDVLKAN